MSVAMLTRRVLCQQVPDIVGLTALVLNQVPRRFRYKYLDLPKPGVKGKSYRRIVHFKDEYTVQPLEITNLGGRDIVTGT